MNEQRNDNDGPLTVMLARGTSFFSGCFISFGPRLRRLLYWLGGIDRRVLATCPKSEQTFHTAIPVLMLIAALATGAGVAYKLKSLFGGGAVASLPIFAVIVVFALCLEAAVLGTLKAGTKMAWPLVTRILMGAMLVFLQTTPILTELLREQIDLQLYNQQIAIQLEAKAKSEKLLDPKTLQAKAAQLAAARDKAIADQAHPPADPQVSQAEKSLTSATEMRKRAVVEARKAETKVQDVRSALARATTDVERANLASRLVRAEANRQNRLQTHNKADAEVSNAKTDLDAARTMQAQRLAEATAATTTAHAQHAEKLANVENEVRAMQERSAKLSEAATRSNPATQIVALMQLCAVDAYVRLMCLAIFLGFALLDLLPSILKMASAKNVYAQAMKAREDSQIAGLSTQRELEDIEHRKVIVLERNQLDAVDSFVNQDRGALESEKLLLRAQAEMDQLSTSASIDATYAALERLGHLQDLLIEQEEKNKAHPEVAPVYVGQLTALLSELQARARMLNADLAAAAAGAPGSRQTSPQGA